MKWSQSFIYTLKEVPEEAESLSHKLMLRTSMVRMLISGVYSYLPFGFRVLNNIEKIIREEMNAIGAQELLLPAIQPLELWQKTKRDEQIGEVMFRFQDRRGRRLCLGPTHEEVITNLVSGFVQSYRDLPVVLYQIQTKFRDELRPRFGLVRGCEFIMKDAYSFDKDENGLDEIYKKMYVAYNNIFKRSGLNCLSLEADSGLMGGDVSHEFMVIAESGEDLILKCQSCQRAFSKEKQPNLSHCPICQGSLKQYNALEVGHIFKLKTKYSELLNLKFLDENGHNKPVIMGCYGIGVSRLIPAIIEENNDKDGIIWPKEIAPFDVEIVTVNANDQLISNTALLIHQQLEQQGLEVLFDDRDERAGIKFKDADLLGIPLRITLGERFRKENKIEIQIRRTKESRVCNLDEVKIIVLDLLGKLK